jgi:valyl-tRNA synthetase
MPFVTEEVWQRLPRRKGQEPSIMISPFPRGADYGVDPVAEREMDLVARAIEGARSVRGEVNLPPNQPVPIVLLPRDREVQRTFREHEHAFKKLANASEVTVLAAGAARPRKAAVHVEAEVEVHLPLEGLIDFAAEKVRVEKEIGKIETDLLGLEKRLGNPGFVARAPPEVVEKDRARAAELQAKRDKLARHLSRVASPEESMDEQHNGRNHDGEPEDDEKEQGHRGVDQLGTHGGPAGGKPAAGAEAATEGEEEEGEEGEEEQQHETSGHAGYSSEAEAEKEEGSTKASREDEEEGLAAQAVSRVKSIARGLMSKKDDDDDESGPKTESEKLDEMAKVAPKVQRRAAKRKASKVTRGKTGKADVGRKSVRGAKNKAAKAGKVGARAKLGRDAAKKGAKKGTRGGTKKQKGRPVGKGDRRAATGRGPGSPGQGRTSAKGGRGKTGGKQRPSPRRSVR